MKPSRPRARWLVPIIVLLAGQLAGATAGGTVGVGTPARSGLVRYVQSDPSGWKPLPGIARTVSEVVADVAAIPTSGKAPLLVAFDGS
jgi:hypothetical protein